MASTSTDNAQMPKIRGKISQISRMLPITATAPQEGGYGTTTRSPKARKWLVREGTRTRGELSQSVGMVCSPIIPNPDPADSRPTAGK